jgi:predicted acylesterase/phospholipase RssA
MVIKHIVISGGGPTGFLSYGAAKHLAQQQFWSHDNIESIYGTSIGSLIGAMICLKHDWNTLDDYIIKRPWEKVIVNSLEMFELFSQKGMAKLKLLDDIMEPLLESKDLSINTTLLEFYEYSRISLNVFTVELNRFEKVHISHTTHPNLALMDAIKMSCCMPVLFQPIVRDGSCYIDGGIMVNYPLRECLENTKCEANEVLGLRNVWHNPNEGIGNHSSIVEYLRFINLQLTRMVNKMTADANLHGVHEVLCYVKPDITPAEWLSIMSDAAQRLAWINDGITYAKSFLDASSKSSQNANSTEEKERNSSETK